MNLDRLIFRLMNFAGQIVLSLFTLLFCNSIGLVYRNAILTFYLLMIIVNQLVRKQHQANFGLI